MRTKFVLLATFVILTFSFANGTMAKDKEYELLRREAKVCRVGTPIKLEQICKTCNCVSKGVIECTIEPGCESSSSISEEGQQDRPSEDLPQQKYQKLREEASNCKVGEPVESEDCNTCYCVEDGVVECTRVLCPGYKKHLESPPKETSDSDFGKLKESAKFCKPGNEPLVIGCRVCVCLVPGVMSCRKNPCDQSSDTPEDRSPEDY